ncbi:MAG: histidine kinase [Acidimicrobiales bacterium]|jgi:signal transduction histidine kinase
MTSRPYDVELRPPWLHRVTPTQWQLLDVGLALFFMLGVIQVAGLIGPGAQTASDLEIGLGLAASGAVALRRLWPIPVLVVVAVLVGITIGLGQSFAAVPIVAFPMATVAMGYGRKTSLVALGVAEITLVAGSAVALALWPQSPGSSNIIVTAAAWFIGDSIRARRIYVQGIAEQSAQRLRDESERAERALVEQRTEIARELHDVVAHGMSVIAVQAGVGRHVINDRPDEAAKALEAIQMTSRSALGDLRRVLALLRRDGDQEPANLEPSPGLRELPSLLEQVRGAGVAVLMEVKGTAVGLPEGMDLTAYRIVQEALTNVVKHAGGATASVVVEYRPDSLVIEVADSGNGSGEVTTPAGSVRSPVGAHHGLVGMRERVALFDGTLELRSIPGAGLEICASLPLTSVAP